MKKQDEIELWDLVVKRQGSPRQLGQRLGIHPKRVYKLCLKWADQGIYEYGVCADLGWPIQREPLRPAE